MVLFFALENFLKREEFQLRGVFFETEKKLGFFGTLKQFFYSYTPAIDVPFAVILSGLYIFTLAYNVNRTSVYYIFPTPLESYQIDFITSRPDYYDHSYECDILISGISTRVEYRKSTNNSMLFAIFQGIFFCYQFHSMVTSQNDKYNWISGDEILNQDSTDCPYFDIVNYRELNLTEEILHDWEAISINYGLWLDVFKNEGGEFDAVHKQLGPEKIKKLRDCLVSVKEKAPLCVQQLRSLAETEKIEDKKEA